MLRQLEMTLDETVALKTPANWLTDPTVSLFYESVAQKTDMPFTQWVNKQGLRQIQITFDVYDLLVASTEHL